VKVGSQKFMVFVPASFAYIGIVLLAALFLFHRPVMEYSYNRIRETSDWMLQENHIRPVNDHPEICIVNTPFLLPNGDHIRYSGPVSIKKSSSSVTMA